MRTSAPGSEPGRPRWGLRRSAGFTLLELLVVLAIVAIAATLVSLSLRDGTQVRLEEEGARLAALLESARTEARAAGIVVRWVPAVPDADASDGFRFVGLPADAEWPTHWLSSGVRAEVIGARALLLGPEPVLPPQRVVLHLDDHRLVLASDGLAPFAAASETEHPQP